MKKSKMNKLNLLLLFIIFFGCTQNKTNINVEAENEAIRDIYDNYYFKGINTNDLDLFMNAWANDAIRMEPEFFPIVGKEEIKAHFKNIFESVGNQTISPYGEMEVEVEGNLAFARGAVIVKGISKADSSEVFLDIKWIDVVKKQSNGTWKIYIDHSSFNPILSEEPVDSGPGEDNSLDPAL